MAKEEIKTKKAAPKKATKSFTLKYDYKGLKKGNKVELGAKGEAFYKSLNLI